MSERLRERFQRAKAEGRPLFIGYITGGFPEPGDTVELLLAMEAGGAVLPLPVRWVMRVTSKVMTKTAYRV